MCETDRRYYQLEPWLIRFSQRFNIYIVDQIKILFKLICNCVDGTDETSIYCVVCAWVCAVPRRSIILVAHMECVMCASVRQYRFCIIGFEIRFLLLSNIYLTDSRREGEEKNRKLYDRRLFEMGECADRRTSLVMHISKRVKQSNKNKQRQTHKRHNSRWWWFDGITPTVDHATSTIADCKLIERL